MQSGHWNAGFNRKDKAMVKSKPLACFVDLCDKQQLSFLPNISMTRDKAMITNIVLKTPDLFGL